MHARTFISGYILSAVEMRTFRLRFERAGSSVENVHVPTLADCGLEFPRAVEPCIFVGTRQILTRDAKHISTGTEVALRFLSGCTPATLTTVSPQSSATAHDNSLNVVMPLEFHPNRGK